MKEKSKPDVRILGRTRFFMKPNLMPADNSFTVESPDPMADIIKRLLQTNSSNLRNPLDYEK
jgi:hypothetical protein